MIAKKRKKDAGTRGRGDAEKTTPVLPPGLLDDLASSRRRWQELTAEEKTLLREANRTMPIQIGPFSHFALGRSRPGRGVFPRRPSVRHRRKWRCEQLAGGLGENAERARRAPRPKNQSPKTISTALVPSEEAYELPLTAEEANTQ